MKKNDRPGYAKVVETLCLRIDGCIKPNGKLNVARAANAIGMHQVSLRRIVNGDYAGIQQHNINKICNYFGLSVSELMGETPIPHAEEGSANTAKLHALEKSTGVSIRGNITDHERALLMDILLTFRGEKPLL